MNNAYDTDYGKNDFQRSVSTDSYGMNSFNIIHTNSNFSGHSTSNIVSDDTNNNSNNIGYNNNDGISTSWWWRSSTATANNSNTATVVSAICEENISTTVSTLFHDALSHTDVQFKNDEVIEGVECGRVVGADEVVEKEVEDSQDKNGSDENSRIDLRMGGDEEVKEVSYTQSDENHPSIPTLLLSRNEEKEETDKNERNVETDKSIEDEKKRETEIKREKEKEKAKEKEAFRPTDNFTFLAWFCAVDRKYVSHLLSFYVCLEQFFL